MELAIMIEGQNGLNWPRWQRIVTAVEELGFAGLYRSDHFTNARPPDKDSLELWVSLTWLADHTRRIRFGPLVTPFSFRHPALTARMAAAVDDLSGGRLTLGVGAGWQEREHDLFGFELLPPHERFERFEEGVRVLRQLLRVNQPVSFIGQYYRLKEAQVLPAPQRGAHLPILIGGNGRKRTLPLAARYADEWNAIFLTPSAFCELNRYLDELIFQAGRQPAEVERSMMTGLVFGKDSAALEEKMQTYGGGGWKTEDLRARGMIVGTADEVLSQINALREAGVQRLMLQWLDLDDLNGLEALASSVLAKL
ncbi:LLM class F420-dependent oxidoreductase [Bellilinea sp.]|uniref:LLM class F420-dependent oxidoreductase n=1 Tax=Bellilinea sp. TaxID=2838785 RepID=UPI002ADE7651|nr:LLM class F420-dependent oxidoreductase [Bellilinea sp.]